MEEPSIVMPDLMEAFQRYMMAQVSENEEAIGDATVNLFFQMSRILPDSILLRSYQTLGAELASRNVEH